MTKGLCPRFRWSEALLVRHEGLEPPNPLRNERHFRELRRTRPICPLTWEDVATDLSAVVAIYAGFRVIGMA